MRFACEGCSAKYMIPDDKVGPAGVKVRCKKCGHVTHVRRPPSEAAAPVAASAPVAAPIRAAPPAAAPAARSAAAAGVEWWVAIGDQPVGPLGIAEVRRRWESGEIAGESLCWYPELPEWAPIHAVPALRAQLAIEPPPPPPAAVPPAPPPPPQPLDDFPPPPAPPPDDLLAPPAPPEAPPVAEPRPSEPSAAPPSDPAAPLPMAPLERTGEHRLERSSDVEEKERGPRTFTVVLVVLLVLAVAGAVAARFLLK